MTRSTFLSVAATCLGVLAASTLPGCSSSEDKHTFTSTVYSPKTIRVVDGLTNQVQYEWVGEPMTELVLRLDSEGGGGVFRADRGPATTLEYTVIDTATRGTIDSGEMELTGQPHIQTLLRPSPRRSALRQPTPAPVATAPASPATAPGE